MMIDPHWADEPEYEEYDEQMLAEEECAYWDDQTRQQCSDINPDTQDHSCQTAQDGQYGRYV